LRRTQDGNSDNERVYLWYNEVTTNAIASTFDTVAFQPMRNEFAGLKASNYNFVEASKGTYTSGWFQDAIVNGTGITNAPRSDAVTLTSNGVTATFSKTATRGYVDMTQHGWQDEPLSSGSGAASERWLNAVNVKAAGEFSAPVLYAVGTNNGAPETPVNGHWIKFDRRDPYRKGFPTTQDRWETSLRVHRERLESIESTLNQQAGLTQPAEPAWARITPWVPAVGIAAAEITDAGNVELNNYFLTARDLNKQLGLLRSKQVTEILQFNSRVGPNDPPPSPGYTDGYDEFERVFKQVYEPYVSHYVMCRISNNYPLFTSGSDPNDVVARQDSRVTDTNTRVKSGVGERQHKLQGTDTRTITGSAGLDGSSQPLASWFLPRVRMRPEGQSSNPGILAGETIRITLELDATVENTSPGTQLPMDQAVFDVRIKLSNPTNWSQSQYLVINDDLLAPASMLFYAPRERTLHTDGSTKRVTQRLRRTFEVCGTALPIASYVNQKGSMEFSVEVRAYVPPQANATSLFTTWPARSNTKLLVDYDLFQVTRIDSACQQEGDGDIEPFPGGGMQMAMIGQIAVGADMNGDMMETLEDVDMFLDAYVQQNTLAADRDGDELVTTQDLANFVDAMSDDE
jgi:hypothetical protein